MSRAPRTSIRCALPPGMAPGLDFNRTYDPPPMTYSNATHACEVEIDPATGALRILRYVVAEDCGTVLNPVVVEGQQHGAIAMGLSGALFEQVVYDDERPEPDRRCSPTTWSPPRPTCRTSRSSRCTRRAAHTPAGIKGMAEGGVMGAIGALTNAVNDALAPFGVVAERQPLTPDVPARPAAPGRAREGEHHVERRHEHSARVGFIGLGIMGRQHGRATCSAPGIRLHVYNRSRGGADGAAGGRRHLARHAGRRWPQQSDVVITIVGYPADVEAVYLGPGGSGRARAAGRAADRHDDLQPGARACASPRPLRRSGVRRARRAGLGRRRRRARRQAVDHGRRRRRRPSSARCRCCALMGTNVVLQGGPGAGQHTKMCNQIVIASTMHRRLRRPGLRAARRASTRRRCCVDRRRRGAAASCSTHMGPRMLQGDFAPGFFTEHFIKDMGIALAEAQRMELDLPGLALAKRLYDGLAARRATAATARRRCSSTTI